MHVTLESLIGHSSLCFLQQQNANQVASDSLTSPINTKKSLLDTQYLQLQRIDTDLQQVKNDLDSLSTVEDTQIQDITGMEHSTRLPLHSSIAACALCIICDPVLQFDQLLQVPSFIVYMYIV